jgi:hypothetical protein
MPKKKVKSKKWYKDKAWNACSRYIRQKYSVDGFCECFTCGLKMPWQQAQAGHGVSGRSNGVLFLEEVIRPQCMPCNVFKHGAYEVFIPKLIELYTLEGFKEFERMKHQVKPLSKQDFQDIEADYEDRIRQLSTEG